jgi:hypothetical protein
MREIVLSLAGGEGVITSSPRTPSPQSIPQGSESLLSSVALTPGTSKNPGSVPDCFILHYKTSH